MADCSVCFPCFSTACVLDLVWLINEVRVLGPPTGSCTARFVGSRLKESGSNNNNINDNRGSKTV